MARLRGQLKVEHQRAEHASKAFYESDEYAALEDTNINIGREEVFYTIWRRYPYLNFSFLGQGVLDVIEGFKAKLAEELTLITEVLDDKVHQPGEEEHEAMDEDEGRQQ